MLKILFVGDKSSKKNTHPEIPFLGTASGKRLNRWIEMLRLELGSTEFTVMLKNSDQGIDFTQDAADLIIALGNNASKRLLKAKIRHWKMPHPSPRNRIWNNHKNEVREVVNIAAYIKGVLRK